MLFAPPRMRQHIANDTSTSRSTMNDTTRHDDLDFRICRYLDGDMTAGEAAAFERELAADAALGAALERYRHLEAELGDLGGAVELDEAAQRDKILQAVERRRLHRPTRPQRLILRPALAGLAAAAMFLLALGGYFLLTGPEQSTPIAAHGESVGRAAMAFAAPPTAKQGGVQTALRRKSMFEDMRHRLRTLGDGAVVVTVGSPVGQADSGNDAHAASSLWMN